MVDEQIIQHSLFLLRSQ